MERIDVYSHVMPTAVFEEYKRIQPGADPPPLVDDPILRDDGIDQRLELLDAYDVGTQVISLTLPRVSDETEPGDVLELTRLANDEVRRIADDHPDRFVPIATVPFLEAEYVDEVERCLDDLDMAGLQVDSNVNGRMLDEEAFYPVYERVNDADVPLWIHPTMTDWHDYDERESFLYRMIAWPFDTSMAVLRLIYKGVLDEFENLELVAHHLGGVLPYLEERMRNWTGGRVDHPERYPPDALPWFEGDLDDYLARVYGDTAVFSTGLTHALRSGYEFFGPDNVIFGFDFPYAREEELANTIAAIDAMDVPTADKEKIYAGNAERLLGL